MCTAFNLKIYFHVLFLFEERCSVRLIELTFMALALHQGKEIETPYLTFVSLPKM